MSNGLTFRSSKIVYYGPHLCNQCGSLICKMAQGYGGNAFTYPSGPIYPNTEWHVHVCNPKEIIKQKAFYAEARVKEVHPTAHSVESENLGWEITSDIEAGTFHLSGVNTYYGSAEAAWIGAKAKVFPTEGEASPEYDIIKSDLQPRNVLPSGIDLG